MKHVLLLIVTTMLIWSGDVMGQSSNRITGFITDARDQSPLTGATIVLDDTSLFGVAGLDGSFVIRNVPDGEYTYTVSYVSYITQTGRISVDGEDTELRIRMEMSRGEMDAVMVRASRDLRTEQSARMSEYTSPTVVNVVDARSIEISPDLTVANVVQRISGVSLERSSSGDGQHAIVRGMDKRYNYTLVNGIKIPSPEVKNRYVPLDIFPSDLLDRLIVTKALTADMEGDAIGGVIDMRMRNAPDRLVVNANVGGGYSQIFADQNRLTSDFSVINTRSPHARNGSDYRASVEDFTYGNMDFRDGGTPVNNVLGLAVGNRFLDNRLGVIAAGSLQRNFRGASSLFFEMDVDRENNNPFYDTVQDRQISTEQIRGGVHVKTDYQINDRHKIDFYNAAIRLEDRFNRAYADTNLRIGRGQGVGTGRISQNFRTRNQIQQIYNSTLQGTHLFADDKLLVDWSAVYSLATNDDPDMVDLKLITGRTRNSAGEFVDERVLLDRDLKRRWTNNDDEDIAGYVNALYTLDLGRNALDLKAGAMYRHKNRTNSYNEYLLRASPITQEWTGDINNHSWNLFNPGGTPTDPLNYESEEDIFAYYGMATFERGRFRAIGGVRVEQTDFSWVTNGPAQIPGRVGDRNYTDVLPSIHLRYQPMDMMNLRLSYFQSISRPNFFEVIPYSINEDDFRERGNPFLERTQAQNVDFRFELFPGALDQVMVALFYKEIKDPIESALIIDGQAIILQPNNFGTANNYGFELDVTKYIRQWGLRAYYTYTDSRITTSKIFRFRDDAGNLTSREQSQTRPLQGQSKHISNLSGLYKNTRWGTDLQLSAVYTGRRIIGVSPYYENDIWQRSFWQMDFSAEQRIGYGVTAYLKINNLLNTPLRAEIPRANTQNPQEAPYINTSSNTLVREEYFQQTWLIGFRYAL